MSLNRADRLLNHLVYIDSEIGMYLDTNRDLEPRALAILKVLASLTETAITEDEEQ